MLAVYCRELGAPETLTLEELPDPKPGPGQVLIDVQAAGVNFVDALIVTGGYQLHPPLPFIPGGEVAGVVTALGPDVPDIAQGPTPDLAGGTPAPGEADGHTPATPGVAIGQRVVATTGIGAFATVVAAPATLVVPIPESLDAPRAATFSQSYSTALLALRERGAVQPGETVVVLGAGGGVGLAAVDVAQALGATVIAVASTDEKRQAAQALGATHTLDPADTPLKDGVRQLTDGNGADLVVDPVGGELAEPALRALGNDGRYLVIGFASGTIPSLPLNQVLLRSRTVLGVEWGAWAMARPGDYQRLLRDLLALVASDRLHPVAPQVRPLVEAAQALAAHLERRVVGKVALAP